MEKRAGAGVEYPTPMDEEKRDIVKKYEEL